MMSLDESQMFARPRRGEQAARPCWEERAAVSSACNLKQLLLESFIRSRCGFLLVFIEYFMASLMLHIRTLNEGVLQTRISFSSRFSTF